MRKNQKGRFAAFREVTSDPMVKAANGESTWITLPNGKIKVLISVRDEKGHRHRPSKTVSGGSGVKGRIKQAKQELLEMYPDGKIHAPVEITQPTVRDVMTEWTTFYLQEVEGSTASNYRTMSRKHVISALGDIPVADLTTARVNAWLREMADGATGPAYSKNTIRLAKKVLAMGLDHALSEKRVRENVAKAAKIPKAATRPTRALSTDEIKAFRKSAQGDRLECAFLIQLALGLRLGEVLALSWGDIDGDMIHVRHSQHRHGNILIARGTVKTEHSHRTLAIPSAIAEAIETRREAQDDEREKSMGIWRNPDDLIFTNEIGGPVRPETYGRSFRAIRDAAGIKNITSHGLRHTAASQLVDAGIPLGVVADLLGHVDMSQLVETYRHSTSAAVSGHLEAMDAVLAGTK